jgi:futalosine hydrolase
MQLLLCAATEFEIRPVMDWMANDNIQNVDVLITGVGMTAATYSITKQVLTKRPYSIIQAGIGGCLNRELPLTKVVLVENETIADLGVQEKAKFKSVFDLGLINREEFPWTGGRLSNNLQSLKESGLPVVDGITVNEISTNPERIEHYRKHSGASVESMEGAALHYVALKERVAFLQIRSLSNFAGERDKTQWVMEMAISSLNIELQKIITKFLNR